MVQGNCDYGPGFEQKKVIQTGQDTVFMTHGHLSNVRFGLTQLAFEARAANADMVFFGHTHQIGCEMDQKILFLNPGSISQPRGPIQIPSYALIESLDDQISVQYYNQTIRAVEGIGLFLFRRALNKKTLIFNKNKLYFVNFASGFGKIVVLNEIEMEAIR